MGGALLILHIGVTGAFARSEDILLDLSLIDKPFQLPIDGGYADGLVHLGKMLFDLGGSMMPAGRGFQESQELFLGTGSIGRFLDHKPSLLNGI